MKLCGFEVGLDRPLFLIAGPCVVESEQLQMDVAGQLKEMTGALGIPFIFKSSLRQGEPQLREILPRPGHGEGPRDPRQGAQGDRRAGADRRAHRGGIAAVAAVVDVLQTPAFLCRQTDFIHAVASAGKPVNIKKGQFLAPGDMKNVVAKAREASGADNILVCERGASFGYNNLVSDMRSLAIMRETGCPVVFDATHSVQFPGDRGPRPGASGNSSRCSPAPRSPPAWRASSWRRTPIPRRRSPTAPTRGPSPA